MPRIRAESIAAHKEASRAAILDAAQKVFLANGFAGGSLTAIADVAGIPRTTIYEYFPSKGHILLAVLEDRIPPLLDQLLDPGDAETPLDRINHLFTAGMAMVIESPELAELMFRVGRELPKDLRDDMWDLLIPISKEIFRQCRAGAESGEFATKQPDRCGRVVADMLVSAVDELTQEENAREAAPLILQSRLAFIRGGLLGG